MRQHSESVSRRDELCLRRLVGSSRSDWEADIAAGGTIYEKYEVINNRTIKQFAEARSNLEQVTTRILQQWAMQFAYELGCDQFIASERWAQKFKQKYNIRQRKITRYVAKEEVTSMENILQAAKNFKIQFLGRANGSRS